MTEKPAKRAAAWIGLAFLACACGAPVDPASPEAILNEERDLATLLQRYSEGKASFTPWAGYWWPYSSDGIAAAASKYDRVAHAHAADWERRNHGRKSAGVESWWGHCNGWSAASVLLPEPRKSVWIGLERFSVGDIKALLTEGAMETDADFFGDRDNRDDVVPNQFLLVLLHYLGRLKQPILFDRNTGPQVWNQPMVGYRIAPVHPEDSLGALPQAPNVSRLMLTATIWWVRDDVAPDAITPEFKFESNGYFDSRVLRFEVWTDGPIRFDDSGHLDRAGDVLLAREPRRLQTYGGAWRMGDTAPDDAWPDTMWIPHSIAPATDYANPELRLDWIQEKLVRPSRA